MSRLEPHRGRFLLGATVALAILAGPAAAGAMADPGAVYSQTNDPAGNILQAFDRDARGELTPAGSFATGGAGSASLGGRQGAVELSDDESTVYAVNAGSNSVSALRVTRDGLALEGVTGSGGSLPASVDEHHGRVYVLNSCGTPNVTAFRARRDGTLEAIPVSKRTWPPARDATRISSRSDARSSSQGARERSSSAPRSWR
jgi:hypothetical protein